MMDINTFRQKADVYGGDLSRWPKELLPAAGATLRDHPEAQRIIDDALAFDAQIASHMTAATMPSIDTAFRTRLLTIPSQNALSPSMQWLLKPSRLAAGIALCGFLGLFVGMNDIANAPFTSADASAWILAPDQSMVE